MKQIKGWNFCRKHIVTVTEINGTRSFKKRFHSKKKANRWVLIHWNKYCKYDVGLK